MFISHVEKVTLQEDVRSLKEVLKSLKVTIGALQCDIQELKLKRPVKIVAPPKKRGRPVGSKNKPKKVTISASEAHFAQRNSIKLADLAKAKTTRRRKK